MALWMASSCHSLRRMVPRGSPLRLQMRASSWNSIAEKLELTSKTLAAESSLSKNLAEIDRLMEDLSRFKRQVCSTDKPQQKSTSKCSATESECESSSSSSSSSRNRSLERNASAPNSNGRITPSSVDYSAWYLDVLAAADMVDQSPVRGCMVIKPWGMAIWDTLRAELDRRIRAAGVSNAYFPIFIPLHFLAKEAEHVDGFAKECAVVTHHRLTQTSDGNLVPDPAAKLEVNDPATFLPIPEPLVVRPTSEAIIWNMFQRWVGSHRDLPLKVNQWANVVRWEMRTRPFLRTSEFLWQEGHTAHATAEEAKEMVRVALEMYADVCRELLAMPVIKGEKTPTERFAGADSTFTIEALMQNGWALQSGTSHFLGQGFSRAFDVTFQNERNERENVWATSWGASTRLIGGMIMTHSDDKGLVLPPRLAPQQIVVVPIINGGDAGNEVLERAKRIADVLNDCGLRAMVDQRSNLRPGAKFFEWERKGVPLRIEIGPKDLSKRQVMLAQRPTGTKSIWPDDDTLVGQVRKLLDEMQSSLYQKALERVSRHTFPVSSYEDMKRMLASPNPQQDLGFYLAPWKCDAANEKKIKDDCKATIRCYPFEHNQQPPVGQRCFFSGEPATHMALFARAY